jgi:3-hydroxyisobutyrate dehydrogenase-like beta-hydroxyacid dehydrogenase
VADVAVVGLGAMGSRIAKRLLARGHAVVVWNRDRAKAEAIAKAGAVVAESPADAALGAEAVITMVTDPEALEAVTSGRDGVLAGGSSATLIQMSTVGAGATARLAGSIPAEMGFLDAPVLGSISEAESGTLKIYVGGPDDLVGHWRELLSDLGDVLHVGPVGAGSAAKLVVNAVLVGVIAVLGESLALSKALGLRQEVTFDVLETTALAAQAKRRRQALESGEFPPRFTLSLARKDADLILEVDPALRVLAAGRAWLAEAEEVDRGGEDYSVVLAYILESADPRRLRSER